MKALFRSSAFDKRVFTCSVGVKQDMLVKDECHSWYDRVGDFLLSVWSTRKEILFGNGGSFEAS